MTAYPFMDQTTQLFHIEKAMRRSKNTSFRSDRLQNRWQRPGACRNPGGEVDRKFIGFCYYLLP